MSKHHDQPKLDFHRTVHRRPTRNPGKRLETGASLSGTPKPWGRVASRNDVRPGGIISIDIAMGDGHDSPNVGCILEAFRWSALSDINVVPWLSSGRL